MSSSLFQENEACQIAINTFFLKVRLLEKKCCQWGWGNEGSKLFRGALTMLKEVFLKSWKLILEYRNEQNGLYGVDTVSVSK